MLTDLSKRLKSLMESEKISRRALAIKTQNQRKSILNWLEGHYYPRYDALIRLADFFKVSCDYLLGESNAYDLANDNECLIEEVPNIFRERLKDYLATEQISMYQLAKRLNIEQSTLSKWMNCGSMPEVAILIRLSKEMDESVDYLLGRGY